MRLMFLDPHWGARSDTSIELQQEGNESGVMFKKR